MLLAVMNSATAWAATTTPTAGDNTTTWLKLGRGGPEPGGFVARALVIRRAQPVLRTPTHPSSPIKIGAASGFDIHWLDRQARPIRDSDWQEQNLHSLRWMLETEDAEGCKRSGFAAAQRRWLPQTFTCP